LGGACDLKNRNVVSSGTLPSNAFPAAEAG
jgi:hypothetical protein